MGPEGVRQLVADNGGMMEWEMLLRTLMPTVHPGQAVREAERIRVKQRQGEVRPFVRTKPRTLTELVIYGQRSKARDWAHNAISRGKIVQVRKDGTLYAVLTNREES